MLFIILMKVAGALVSPKLSTKNSKCPYRVLKAIFGSSLFAILTQRYPDRKSILLKTLTPNIRSSNSSIRGKGYLFFILILFKAR